MLYETSWMIKRISFEQLFEASLDCSGWSWVIPYGIYGSKVCVPKSLKLSYIPKLEEIKSVPIPCAFHAEVAYVWWWRFARNLVNLHRAGSLRVGKAGTYGSWNLSIGMLSRNLCSFSRSMTGFGICASPLAEITLLLGRWRLAAWCELRPEQWCRKSRRLQLLRSLTPDAVATSNGFQILDFAMAET